MQFWSKCFVMWASGKFPLWLAWAKNTTNQKCVLPTGERRWMLLKTYWTRAGTILQTYFLGCQHCNHNSIYTELNMMNIYYYFYLDKCYFALPNFLNLVKPNCNGWRQKQCIKEKACLSCLPCFQDMLLKFAHFTIQLLIHYNMKIFSFKI